MRHAASLRLETAATHGSAFAVSKSALSIHSYVNMDGVGPPSEKNRVSASTASADEPNTHFVHSVADFNNLSAAARGVDAGRASEGLVAQDCAVICVQIVCKEWTVTKLKALSLFREP